MYNYTYISYNIGRYEWLYKQTEWHKNTQLLFCTFHIFFHQLCNIVDPVYGLFIMHIEYNCEGLDL